MELTRCATIRLTRPAPTTVNAEPYRASNGVTVATVSVEGAVGPGPASDENLGSLTIAWPYEHARVTIGVMATVPAGPAGVDEQRRVLVPSEPRIRAEAAIQEYADLLAVVHQCRRLIRSPHASVAVLIEADDVD